MIIVIAGVSGSGKSTVGPLVAGRLRWPYADADTFHPSDNIEKMRAVKPLDDEDRVPWLWTIGEWIDQRITAGEPGVATCSALRRSYRDFADRARGLAYYLLRRGHRRVVDEGQEVRAA